MVEWSNLFLVTKSIDFAICMCGGAFLLSRAKGSRSKYILSLIMLLWGAYYGLSLLSSFTGLFDIVDIMSLGVLNVRMLVIGNLYLIILLLYPVEVVRPGWLNLKRIGLLLLPYLVLTGGFCGMQSLLEEPSRSLNDWNEVRGYMGEFNVWFRWLQVGLILYYLFLLYYLTWRYHSVYEQWYDANYSSTEHMEISWLRNYSIGVMLIGVAFFGGVFVGAKEILLAHTVIVAIFFLYTFYKGLFHSNPYTEDFFRDTLDETMARQELEMREQTEQNGKLTENENDFIRKLPFYRSEVENWLDNKKPYLRADFKLMDVAEILPLNRSYLSRIFNEGFGKSFSVVVRDYRIREAEERLLTQPDIPVGEIGELCGFSSPSVFHRCFVQQHDGITPRVYREQNNFMEKEL